MKLWYSFVKELLLASRSFYFYIELVMAGLFLFLLLFVIPEQFDTRQDEYLYFDGPESGYALVEEDLLDADLDGEVEAVDVEYEDQVYVADVFRTDGANYYVLDDRDVTIGIADQERKFAGIIHMDDSGQITYTYYMQGYETQRLRNIYAVFHNEERELLRDTFEDQDVRMLYESQEVLTDRENVVPSFLTFNGSLMGMFILASYIFLDKKEGVIKAYAVTTAPVWQYLLSKVGVVTLTSLVTSLIITIPVMGTQPNYPALLLFLVATGFAASALGLLLSSFYDDIMQSFGVLYGLIILLLLPNIAYFIPTWNPTWIQLIPTYSMLEGFKESILPSGDLGYVLMVSLGFVVGGLVLFVFANSRFKKTLTI